MLSSAASHGVSVASTSVVSALIVQDFQRDKSHISMPRPEIHVVARFGSSARRGLDVHVLGVREKAHRKLIRRGQRAIMARLRLGAHVGVLGVRASEVAGRTVALEELWGDAAAHRLYDRLAAARDTAGAAVILQRAIEERLTSAVDRSPQAQLALDSAAMLTSAHVNTVADELGVSERHLRRVFRETFGMSPKAFARLKRFHRALGAASESGQEGWASIAAASGYYDQAHLIAEFRAITGLTPQVLLDELRGDAVNRSAG